MTELEKLLQQAQIMKSNPYAQTSSSLRNDVADALTRARQNAGLNKTGGADLIKTGNFIPTVLGVGTNMPPIISNSSSGNVLGSNIGLIQDQPQPNPDLLNKTNLGGNTGGSDDNKETGVDEATARFNAAKNAIMSRLQQMKDEAQRLRGRAEEGYNFVTGEVKKNYEALKNLNNQKMIEGLLSLDASSGEVGTNYSKLGGNVRRALESALGKNRSLFGALGALGSSYYANAQSRARNQAMNAVNDSMLEEAAKQAAISQGKGTTTSDFGLNESNISQEEVSLLNKALQDRNDALAAADMLETNYNINTEQEIADANAALDAAKKAGDAYNSQRYANAANNALTQSQSGNAATYTKSYNPKAGIQDALSLSAGADTANKALSNLDAAGNYVAPTISDVYPTYLNTIKKNARKKDESDLTGYFINR